MMIMFTQSTAVLHKYLHYKLKTLCLLQFFLEVIASEFPEFSTFREIPEYSRFSRFVATLQEAQSLQRYHTCTVFMLEMFKSLIPLKVGHCTVAAYTLRTCYVILKCHS